jgi:hypothetical protein
MARSAAVWEHLDMNIPPSTDPQEYLLEHLFNDRNAAEARGDGESVGDLNLAITAVQKHSPSHGFVATDERQRCVLEDGIYPCAVLKLHAMRFAGRVDFPKILL